MTALNTMVHMKGEIISGLCRDDQLLKQLWTYLREWGEKAGGTSGSIFNSSNAEQWGPVRNYRFLDEKFKNYTKNYIW